MEEGEWKKVSGVEGKSLFIFFRLVCTRICTCIRSSSVQHAPVNKMSIKSHMSRHLHFFISVSLHAHA